MVDKITTVAKSKLQRRIGKLAARGMIRLNRAALVFLGLAGRPA
jgi:mRNA interferase MazF